MWWNYTWWNYAWLRLLACTNAVDVQQKNVLEDSAAETAINTVEDGHTEDTANQDSAVNDVGNDLGSHFSTHFQQWLEEHPEYSNDLVRLDIDGGSFGGFVEERHPLQHRPILFIHGNSDRANGGLLGGWSNMRSYFLEQGFDNAELYATTYGPADILYITDYRHDVDSLRQIRQFIEAVLAYTGAEKVDIVAYSLGVTLARKAILGGDFTDQRNQTVALGSPLTDFVDTFIGIAGANQGLTSCYSALTPTCSDIDGLFPGTSFGFGVTGQAQILQNINASTGYEGTYRYSIWSHADEVLGFGCIVWGVNTAKIPDQTGEKVHFTASHMDLKDHTAETVYIMTQEHRIP